MNILCDVVIFCLYLFFQYSDAQMTLDLDRLIVMETALKFPDGTIQTTSCNPAMDPPVRKASWTLRGIWSIEWRPGKTETLELELHGPTRDSKTTTMEP